jgi:hypothetical protein
MENSRKQIAILRFEGPRFKDHGLDVDVLPELVAYKRLLQETAKEIWRSHHPGRQRLPKNFDAGISLKFFELQSGSTGVPLFREIAPGQVPLPLFEHELDQAVMVLEDAIAAAGATSKFAPSDLPRSVIPLFEQFGQTLRLDECIQISHGSGLTPVRYDQQVKHFIRLWSALVYSDDLNLIGEVRGTDLDGQKFFLRLQDGRKVPGRFQSEQEPLILEALSDHLSRRLRIVGKGHFLDDGTLDQIVDVDRVELLPLEPEETEEQPPIWERIANLSEAMPPETWQSLPSDLSQNIDKYLYRKKDND